MSQPVSRTGLLVLLAFLVPVVVELRTLAGFLGIELSTTAYLAVSAALVVAVLAAVAAWNLRAGNATASSEGA